MVMIMGVVMIMDNACGYGHERAYDNGRGYGIASLYFV